MPTFSQLPAELNVVFVQGDEVEIPLDFDIDLTGYTFTRPIYVVSQIASVPGGSEAVNTPGATATNWSLAVVDAATGRVNIGLTEAQTAALLPSIAYRWYFRWVTPSLVTRTVLSGTVTVVSP
jgi:hypothetical protein